MKNIILVEREYKGHHFCESADLNNCGLSEDELKEKLSRKINHACNLIDYSQFNELNTRVLNWAEEKGIFEKATPLTQIKKTLEEVEETETAIFMQSVDYDEFVDANNNRKNTAEEIKDGFGDILVTVLIGCKMQNLDPLDCLETALNVIEKRTGKMINGTFVKDE